MSVSICGFVDVSYWENAEDEWVTCLDIGSIGLPASETCAVLFGESRWPDEPTMWGGIAHRRGLPDSMGYQTRQETTEALEAQRRYRDIWGFTYLDYEEIRRISWEAYPESARPDRYGPRAWGLLFKLLDTLAANFPSLRLVVWFEHVH